jgi:hypothetical protein
MAAEIGKMAREQDIQLGSPEFDKEFMIKADSETTAKQLLTPQIQEKLLLLRRQHPLLTFEHSLLKIKVPFILRKEEDFDLLIDTMLLLIDRWKEIGDAVSPPLSYS